MYRAADISVLPFFEVRVRVHGHARERGVYKLECKQTFSREGRVKSPMSQSWKDSKWPQGR